MPLTEVVGELESVAYNPDDETLTLFGEYGRYEVATDAETRAYLRSALDALDGGGDTSDS